MDNYNLIIDLLRKGEYLKTRDLSNQDIPSVLYKYVALDDNKQLNNKKLDCLRNIDLHSNTIEHFDDKEEYTKLLFSKSEISKVLQNEINDAKKNDLICCFTSEKNNPLMWTHYANCYKGFLLKFRVDNPQNILKVVYIDDIGICYINNNISDKDKNYLIDLNCIIKGKKWEKQKEYRTIINDKEISEFNKNKYKEKGNSQNELNFSSNQCGLLLQEVSIGYNCEKENINKIKQISKQRGLPTPKIVYFDKSFNFNTEIYSEYGLTQEEIDFIETNLQEMK